MEIRIIEGYEGYWVSDQGDVFTQWVNKGKHGLIKEKRLKKMKCTKQNSGHLAVRLGGRKGKWKYVHRLVYENFKGEIPIGLCVRHLNDIPNDNRIENLEIGTQTDNVRDSIRLGNFPMGETNGQSKLNEEKVLFIRRNVGKLSQTEIASKLGVSRRTVGHVINKKTWKSVK